MAQDLENSYLASIRKQFLYYKMLGDKTLSQITTEEQLFWQYNDASNSIAILVKHLWGNMLSRWTDFLTSDGEKAWRNRDAEFENDLGNRATVLAKWEEGWSCLFEAINPLTTADLERIIYIRNQGHTVTEAINRQLAHYAYHVGQLVFLGKLIQSDAWQTLSIAKGASKAYNATKFAQEKQRQHFSDEFLEEE